MPRSATPSRASKHLRKMAILASTIVQALAARNIEDAHSADTAPKHEWQECLRTLHEDRYTNARNYFFIQSISTIVITSDGYVNGSRCGYGRDAYCICSGSKMRSRLIDKPVKENRRKVSYNIHLEGELSVITWKTWNGALTLQDYLRIRSL